MIASRSRARMTAVEVARACAVNLKTIHNWADKGKLPHTRTDGRHLRFHRLDVVELLRRHAHPVPAALLAERLRVCLAGKSAPFRRGLRRFEIIERADPIDALVSLGAVDPDALVLDDAAWMDDARLVERIRASESSRHVRVVVTCDEDRRDAILRAGARAVLARDDVAALREALDRIAFGAVSAPRGTP